MLRAALVACACAVSALFLGRPAGALDNGKGRVPPIGWNSWCTDVSCTKDYCTEAMVHRQADAVAQHLRPLGWSLITLDDCWGGQRLSNGSYSWDPV